MNRGLPSDEEILRLLCSRNRNLYALGIDGVSRIIFPKVASRAISRYRDLDSTRMVEMLHDKLCDALITRFNSQSIPFSDVDEMYKMLSKTIWNVARNLSKDNIRHLRLEAENLERIEGFVHSASPTVLDLINQKEIIAHGKAELKKLGNEHSKPTAKTVAHALAATFPDLPRNEELRTICKCSSDQIFRIRKRLNTDWMKRMRNLIGEDVDRFRLTLMERQENFNLRIDAN